jgi:DNA replication protein
MTKQVNGKITKCDHKVNITAAFGSDLVLEGFTSIPNKLIKMYSRIGITDFQMLLLIHLIRFVVEERECFPNPEMIADLMESTSAKVKKELADLLDKEIITVSEYYDKNNNMVFDGYDFEPLFLRVSDVWANIRASEIEESEKLLRAADMGRDFQNYRLRDKLSGLISTFENEFGRPLSPIEVEQIQQWESEAEPFIIIEALKRAVLRGKHNFKYINSILFEWKKNNLQTMESIAEYDRDFLKRRGGRSTRKGDEGAGGSPTGGNKDTKEKAFIRSLYIKG